MQEPQNTSSFEKSSGANAETFVPHNRSGNPCPNMNVLFMFGHGLPDRLCGTKVSAFAPLDFSNELVFCGSCMSASPTHADRVNLENQAATKRFGSQAVENGAVMVLGHMGLCGGFPEVYPMAEHVFEGLPVGE